MSFSMSVVLLIDAIRSGDLGSLVSTVNAVACARGIGIVDTWREVVRCLAPRPQLEAQYREWAGADSNLDWDNIPHAIPCDTPAAAVAYSAYPFATVEFAPNP
jgi:hypothetical protein